MGEHSGRAVVLIDGGYFNKINGKARIDFEKLAHELAKPQELWRAYFYDCPPYQSSCPSTDEKERYSKRMKFFGSLSRIPRFTVRLGRLKTCGTFPDGSPRFVQKRVDLLLGLDIADIAASGKIDVVVLLAGDGDFLPAVQAAREKTILVRLAHGPERIDPKTGKKRPSFDKDLWEEADERVEIDGTFLGKCSA